MLRFPYAVSEFEIMINGGYVYMDRTHHIRFIEDWGHLLLFLRPRRFGKSLWLSILMDYYDVNKADDFERLFGHLAIGQNPTPLHNQYMVMRWDFSKLHAQGTAEQLETAFHAYINREIKNFEADNRETLQYSISIHPDNALVSFSDTLGVVQASGYKLYLFIDECDSVANELMINFRDDPSDNFILYENDLTNQSRQREYYQKLVTWESMFKTLFNNLKSFSAGEGLDRVFITGVSPVGMGGVTSGSNVFEDIYHFQELNDLCGFYEYEVANMLADVIKELDVPVGDKAIRQAEALEIMRSYYGGSWFTTEAPPPQSRLYNPTMVLYFLRHLQRTGKYPDQMLDSNLQAYRDNLAYIAHYARGCESLSYILNDKQEIGIFEIETEFWAEELLQADMARSRLASLLCYLGALTINGSMRDGRILLTIPNLVMEKIYAECIQQTKITDMKTSTSVGLSLRRWNS